jgi:HEAT repeat protein
VNYPPPREGVSAELEEQDILNELATLEQTKGQDIWTLIRSIRESRQETPTEELIEVLYDYDIYNNRRLSAAYILGYRNEWGPLEQYFASLDRDQGFIRAVAARILGRFEKDAPVNLLLEASSDKNSGVRLAALRALEDLGELLPAEATAVVELLSDESREIRASALQVLVHVLGYIEVKMPLLEALLALTQDRFEPVKVAAKVCLEKLGQRMEVEFVDNLFRHKVLSICVASVELLGKYASFNQLVTAMQDRRPRVREAAIHVVGQRREQAAIGLLFTALKDRNVAVHKAAIQAIERLGQREALAELSAKGQLTPLLVGTHLALRDFKEWQILARICNVKELLTLRETGSIPLEYLGELDAKLQYNSELLGGGIVLMVKTQISEQQKSADPVSADLSEMYERLSRRAAAMLHDRATVDQLLMALNHEVEDVRIIALQVLADRTPLEQLIAALDDESIQVRRGALRILGERTPIDLLVSALNDESNVVRELAQELLKQRREHMPENELTDALESSSGAMRASAVKVLGGRITAEKLKAMLGDSEEEVRLAAADALRQSYPEILHSLVPELIAVFKGEGPSEFPASASESFMVETIEYMENASPFLIGKLTPLLDWPYYWEVRMKAAQALGKLRHNVPEEAIRRLIELRNGPEPLAVRRAADDALAEVLSLEAGIEEE